MIAWVGHHGSWILVASLVVSVIIDPWFKGYDYVLQEIILILFTLNLIDIRIKYLTTELKHYKTLFLGIVCLLVVSPLLANGIALLLNLDPILHTCLLIAMCSPPVTITFSMLRLIRINGVPALVIMLYSHLACLLTAPVLVYWLVPVDANLDIRILALELVYVIGLGILFAVIIRKLIKIETIQHYSKTIDGLNTLLMSIFIFILFSTDEARSLFNAPTKALTYLVVAVCALVGGNIIASIALAIKGIPSDRIANWAISFGCRNTALIIVALPLEFGRTLFLFLVVVQVPIYLGPLFTRLTHNLVNRYYTYKPTG